MKCPKCGYEYVKNIGKKEFYTEVDSKGDKKRRCENEKKYGCPKCGWRN